MQADTYDLIRRFLLGKLSDNERRAVEERFLSENEFFEQVLSVEDDLIDQYLLGRLNKEDAAQAQALFQSSRSQQTKVDSTRNLISLIHASRSPTGAKRQNALESGFVGSVDEMSKTASAEKALPGERWHILDQFRKTSSLFRTFSLAAAVILFVLLVLLSLYHVNKNRVMEPQRAAIVDTVSGDTSKKPTDEIARRKEDLNSEGQGRKKVEKLNADQPPRPLEKRLSADRPLRHRARSMTTQSRSVRSSEITTILLAPTRVVRSGSAKLVRMNLSKGQVRLQLVIDGKFYDQYRIVITTFDDIKVFESKALKSQLVNQGKLTIVLRADLFDYQDYRIELKGSSDGERFVHVADYVMKVTQ
jgi:anti-sigma-K factor RskA